MVEKHLVDDRVKHHQTHTSNHHHLYRNNCHQHVHHSVPLEDATNRNILRIKREKRRQLRLREYQNLCKLIPSLNGLNVVPKVKIINEAVKYIDELHQQLILKLSKNGSSESEIKAFKDNFLNLNCQMILQNNNQEPITTTTTTTTNPTITSTTNTIDNTLNSNTVCTENFDKQSKLKSTQL